MVELLAALALLIGPPPPSPPSVAWGDAQHAWVGTSTGILASVDGGSTWKKETRAPGLALAAVDARHAWAIADQGQTVRTTDGVHWAYLGVQHLMAISFVDSRNGFALERDGIFLRTRDGGITWKSPWGFRLQSICFSDARTGWVARNGIVWTTHDGGTHWRAKSFVRAGVATLACHGQDVWVVFHEGAAAGTEGYDIFASSNAGATWRERYASPFVRGMPHVSNYSGPVVALGDSDAVLEGSCSPCGNGYGTVTFVHGQIRTTLTSVLPGPVAFGDPERGLAVLQSAPRGPTSIYRTIDGGARWRRVWTL